MLSGRRERPVLGTSACSARAGASSETETDIESVMVLGSVPVRLGPAYRTWSYTGQIQNGIGTGGCSDTTQFETGRCLVGLG